MKHTCQRSLFFSHWLLVYTAQRCVKDALETLRETEINALSNYIIKQWSNKKFQVNLNFQFYRFAMPYIKIRHRRTAVFIFVPPMICWFVYIEAEKIQKKECCKKNREYDFYDILCTWRYLIEENIGSTFESYPRCLSLPALRFSSTFQRTLLRKMTSRDAFSFPIAFRLIHRNVGIPTI